MASLHTWTGLLPGWVLFLIFLFGTVAFFQEEVSRWMRPELASGPVTSRALDASGALLAARAAGADSWTLSLPGNRGGEGFTASWIPAGRDWSDREEVMLDSAGGREIAVRDTQGGWFLYRFHFDLHYMPYWLARYIVSIAALAMLVAILSGIVTHKKIFADFFLLRFGKGQRSWLDAHNVTAVLALPFYLMMTYTGLVALLFTLMPWAISVSYPNGDDFYADAFPRGLVVEASGTAEPLLPISELVARARAAHPGFAPASITVSHPGDASAMVEMWPRADTLAGPRSGLYLNGVTGALLPAPRPHGAASVTYGVMVDLHAGRFSGPMLRWLYFLSGVGGTVMVASGLVLWTVKRRAKLPDPTKPHVGFRLVERLNIGVIVGGTGGIAVYFIANRLLPLDMAHRADWEINSLFIGWGALFVWSIGRPVKQAWTETLAMGALLYAAVPVVSAFTTPRGLIPSLFARDWVFAGFDLTMLALAGGFALAGWKVAAHRPKVAARRKVCELAEAVA
jgi:uncharacterized iron-regulated membrane protein